MPKTKIPKDKGIDNTLALSQEGYLFIKNRADLLLSDVFETHLLGQKAICITGKEAAMIFYNPKYFLRKGVMPKRVQKTLFGENAIQGMDGKAHLHRKALFLSIMKLDNQNRLIKIVKEEWKTAIPKWENMKEVNLFQEAKEILCKSVCLWAGVPLLESEITSRAEDFAAMVDSFGAVGPNHWRGRVARTRTEEWIKTVIENVRIGRLIAPEDTALYAIAFHKELNNNLMDTSMCAIELINVLRPIVAISTYIVFTALALYDYPKYKSDLMSGDSTKLEMFVQEVRRFYPFTPFLGAKVKKNFDWNNYEFKKGELVILDVYGINHDSRIWSSPFSFQPERFKDYSGDPFGFIPQGGGDPSTGHRCPGEGITIEIMKVTLDFLVNKIEYMVPEQDLSYDMAKIPTYPKSGFVMNSIKQK